MSHSKDPYAARVASHRRELFMKNWVRQPAAIPVALCVGIGASIVSYMGYFQFRYNNTVVYASLCPPSSPILILIP